MMKFCMLFSPIIISQLIGSSSRGGGGGIQGSEMNSNLA